MNDEQLKEMETFAVGMTRQAGAILLEHFQKPLTIEYKSKDQTNPVTDADKRSEEYLKEAILKEYPDHSMLAEEGSQVDSSSSDFTWVIDPLDGTVNFINGLPIFGVSVGVLQKGQPVLGCIFTPSPGNSKGSVYHARRGGGAFRDDEAIRVSQDYKPRRGRISIFPAFYARFFHLKKGFRGEVGELRSLGSVAYELAMTASGVIQYSLFGSPWVWDVAAGIILVTEAQGVALVRREKQRHWEPFRGFTTPEGDGFGAEELKEWRSSWIFGGGDMTRFVTSHLTPRSRLELMLARWLRRWL